MPGGRLTLEDRRLIATWLTEGLGYAEMARRLGRPTSTISREVARNSGHSGYRAEEASRATGHRARRRKPVPAKPVPAVADDYGRDPGAVLEQEENFVELMVQTGLPRMMARVLGGLYSTDSGALTAAELAQRLQVSPASISNAVGYLENLEMLKRERDGRRRERYIVDDDSLQRGWHANVRANAEWVELAGRGAELYGIATPAGARMDEVARFYRRIHLAMLDESIPVIGGDALTVLAGLLHAARPLTVEELSEALAWPVTRVTAALRVAEDHPEVTGPVTVVEEDGAHRAVPRVERLTAVQLAALHALRS